MVKKTLLSCVSDGPHVSQLTGAFTLSPLTPAMNLLGQVYSYFSDKKLSPREVGELV